MQRSHAPHRALSVLLLLATFLSGALANQGGRWQTLSPLNLARQETGAARIGNLVYVVGGLLNAAPFVTNTVEVYDISLDLWTFGPPLPIALDHMGVAALGGKLYVMGGFSGDFAARSELWILDPSSGIWSPGQPLPSARGGGWAVSHGTLIYFFGGVDVAGVAQPTTFIYDPGLDQWTTGADMPTAREHLTAAASGDFIYVLGGRGNGFGARNMNERYDPAADRWTALTPMPTARSAMATAALGERIIVAGGELPMLHAVNEIYDIPSDTWHCQDAMPIPRHGVAAVALDDRILLPGGGIVQGFGATASVDVFQPGPLLELNGNPRPGQPVSFSIRFAPSHEIGARALVALSCSGTAGISLPGGRTLPLTFDGCTLLGLQFSVVLKTTLDASGGGTTPTVPFPPIPSGTWFFAAAFTFDPGSGNVLSTTLPLSVISL